MRAHIEPLPRIQLRGQKKKEYGGAVCLAVSRNNGCNDALLIRNRRKERYSCL